jgi:hypothetical protein
VAALIILCQDIRSADLGSLSISIPLIGILLTFVLNILNQERLRNRDKRDELENKIIGICDKMLRTATNAELMALEFQFYAAYLKIKPDSKAEEDLSKYYHKEAEICSDKYDILKSELKNLLRDFNKYWNKNEITKVQILKLMRKIVMMNPRNFMYSFDGKYETIDRLWNDKVGIQKTIRKDVIFENMGLYLLKIQKLIDPASPTLILLEEHEANLDEYIKTFEAKQAAPFI